LRTEVRLRKLEESLRRLVGAMLAAALILSVIAGSVIASRGGIPGNDGPVPICNLNQDGSFTLRTVNASAVPAHLAQGDVLPDTYGNCP
jgi:hypothetical protein